MSKLSHVKRNKGQMICSASVWPCWEMQIAVRLKHLKSELPWIVYKQIDLGVFVWLSSWSSFPLSHVTSQESGAQASLHLPCVYFLENPGNPNTILVWFVGSPKFMCWRPVVSASVLVSGKFKEIRSWKLWPHCWRHYHERVIHCLDHVVPPMCSDALKRLSPASWLWSPGWWDMYFFSL